MDKQATSGQPFWVLGAPRIFWDANPKQRCVEFCDHVDASYYEVVASSLVSVLNATDDDATIRRLDAAIRFFYLHAQETLFTSLLALVQAPTAVVPYFSLLNNAKLLEAVGKISRGEFDYGINVNELEIVTWKTLSNLVHMPVRSATGWDVTTRQFASFWEEEAAFYTSELPTREYNALKHSSRVFPQAFKFHVQSHTSIAGDSAESTLREASAGDHGSQFFAVEPMLNVREAARGVHITVSHQAINWDRQRVLYRLQLLSCSIANTMRTIRLMNDPTDVGGHKRPENQEIFALVNHTGAGMRDLNIHFPIELPKENQYSADEVAAMLPKIRR